MDVVLSLSWQSAYQSVRGLVRHFGKCWRAAGLELLELSISSPGWETQLREVVNNRRVRFVLCTSGIGSNISIDGENIWTKLQLPVFSLLLDHPAYFAAHHRTQSKTTVLGYMFRDHALYQTRDVKADNIVTSIDFGVPDLPVQELRSQGRPRIIFAKTGNAPEALLTAWREAPQLERILHDVLDELALEKTGLANCGIFHPLITRIAAAHRIELQKFDLLSRYLIAQIDDYIRRLKSTLIAKALLPFDVDVFGSHWEHIGKTGAKAKFHGPVDYEKIEAEFGNATASLTMNPNVNLAAHDRFFTAIGAGIMPLGDNNRYIAETFPEVLPYSFDFTPGSIASALEKAVNYPEAALETARAVRARTRSSCGVEKAAAAILETMESAAYLHFTPKTGQDFFVP